MRAGQSSARARDACGAIERARYQRARARVGAHGGERERARSSIAREQRAACGAVVGRRARSRPSCGPPRRRER